MSANDRQPGGTHYVSQPIQTWDFINENGIGFIAGNVIKYVARYQKKGGLTDLQKANHYLEKLMEVETARMAEELRQLAKANFLDSAAKAMVEVSKPSFLESSREAKRKPARRRK